MQLALTHKQCNNYYNNQNLRGSGSLLANAARLLVWLPWCWGSCSAFLFSFPPSQLNWAVAPQFPNKQDFIVHVLPPTQRVAAPLTESSALCRSPVTSKIPAFVTQEATWKSSLAFLGFLEYPLCCCSWSKIWWTSFLSRTSRHRHIPAHTYKVLAAFPAGHCVNSPVCCLATSTSTAVDETTPSVLFKLRLLQVGPDQHKTMSGRRKKKTPKTSETQS